MRLILWLIGAAALAATGWICWRATERSRQWREFQKLGSKTKPSDAERSRLTDLSWRLFPDEPSGPRGVTILEGPGDRRRILVLFVSRDNGRRKARLHVLDEDGGRRSTCDVPMGPCGVECRLARDRGPWAFDIAQLTPGSPIFCRYWLVDDRSIPVGLEVESDDE